MYCMKKVIVDEVVVDSDIEAAIIIAEIESTTGMISARIIDADVLHNSN